MNADPFNKIPNIIKIIIKIIKVVNSSSQLIIIQITMKTSACVCLSIGIIKSCGMMQSDEQKKRADRKRGQTYETNYEQFSRISKK